MQDEHTNLHLHIIVVTTLYRTVVTMFYGTIVHHTVRMHSCDLACL